MKPVQLNRAERDALDELDDKHRNAKRALDDVYRMYIDVISEVENDAYNIQCDIIKKYGMDEKLDYRVEKETGIMTEYTAEQQKGDGAWEHNPKSEGDRGRFKISDVEDFLRKERKDLN